VFNMAATNGVLVGAAAVGINTVDDRGRTLPAGLLLQRLAEAAKGGRLPGDPGLLEKNMVAAVDALQALRDTVTETDALRHGRASGRAVQREDIDTLPAIGDWPGPQ
jgi:hypothetical protein